MNVLMTTREAARGEQHPNLPHQAQDTNDTAGPDSYLPETAADPQDVMHFGVSYDNTEKHRWNSHYLTGHGEPRFSIA